MTELSLHSEPFACTGNMAAEGFRRLLGRPTLSLLQTVLREGIQNVLDASCASNGSTVMIRLRTLSPMQQQALGGQVLAQRPGGDATRQELDASLEKERLCVLELCDFGTEGLSGPTRADVPHDNAEPLNFVNFLRNVGAARDIHQGGGTYGYGKSSLYAMSSCSTIVVDSQTRWGTTRERRLMACHLGAAFDATDRSGTRRRFTGRHWWGVPDGEDSVDPATGSHAAELALALGLPDRSEAQTGTSILIIDPQLGEGNSSQTAMEIVETVLWNFWPRMTATTRADRRLTVQLEVDGKAVPVPEPENFPPLDLYAMAMATLCGSGAGEVIPVWCNKPKQMLGKLVIQKGFRADRRGSATRQGSLIPSQSSHIALMRPVGLVVRYLEGDCLPDRRFEWAGVFICSDDDDVEGAFALAEPPAHDDWIPQNLPPGRARTFVNVALRRLAEVAKPSQAASLQHSSHAEATPSLASVATKLGRLLDRSSSTGPGRQARKVSAPQLKKSLSVSQPRFDGLQLGKDGRRLARFSAELHNDASNSGLELIAEPYLVMDGASAPAGELPDSYSPEIVTLTVDTLQAAQGSHRIRVGHQSGVVQIVVVMPSDAAVGVSLRIRTGDAG